MKARELTVLMVFVALFALAGDCVAEMGYLDDLGVLESNSSEANGVSADGSVVAGEAYASGNWTAFRWTKTTGMQNLGTSLPIDWSSEATGVSGDGGSIIINSYGAAYRWTQTGGAHPLGTLGGATYAMGISHNGAVVVGGSADTFAGYDRAFRWAGDNMQNLGILDTGPGSAAYAVSANGQVVVGLSGTSLGSGAFIYTSGAGMQSLGVLPGGNYSIARGVSSDGSVVVGQARNSGSNLRAFRYTEADGMVDLGTLGGSASNAKGVSADGKVVVGTAYNSYGTERAFRWTQETGMQTINDWLATCGVDTGALYFMSANAANSDGSIVVGRYSTGHAYRAYCCVISHVKNEDTSTFYDTIKAGYDAAQSGDSLLMHSASFTGDVLLNNLNPVKLKGGFDCAYENSVGHTTIIGAVTASGGAVTLDSLIIR